MSSPPSKKDFSAPGAVGGINPFVVDPDDIDDAWIDHWAKSMKKSKADHQKVLADCDRLTGEVKTLDKGILEFKTDDVGTLEVSATTSAALAAFAKLLGVPFETNGALDATLRIQRGAWSLE